MSSARCAVRPGNTLNRLAKLKRRFRTISQPKTLGAWGVSAVFHGGLIVLLLLTSSAEQRSLEQRHAPPKGYLDQPQESLEVAPIITDLQVEPVQLQAPPDPMAPLALAERVPELPSHRPGPRGLIASQKGSMDFDVAASGGLASRFCGTAAQGRNVCFVVDHSASMLVAMTYVRNELSRAVYNLSPGQCFQVILYAGDQPRPLPQNQMARATRHQKQRVLQHVQDAPSPAAHSPEEAVQSVISAVRTAFASRSPSGEGPSVIYLLTDGQYDRLSLCQAIDDMQKQLPARIPINIVACGGGDHEELLRLARTNQGQYRYISPRELDEAILDQMEE